MPRLARSLLGCLGFSCQSVTASFSSRARMPNRCASPMRHALDRDGHVRALAPVLLDERPVVHLVDVVAGEDEHDVRGGLRGWSGCSGARRPPCPDTTPPAGCARCTAASGGRRRCVRSRSHGRPAPMWSLSERGLYCVRTTTSLMSELTQLLSVKSMIRYLPANGHGGLGPDPREDREALALAAGQDDRGHVLHGTMLQRGSAGCVGLARAIAHDWRSTGPAQMYARGLTGVSPR